jgi:hypothetical protein
VRYCKYVKVDAYVRTLCTKHHRVTCVICHLESQMTRSAQARFLFNEGVFCDPNGFSARFFSHFKII